MTGWIIAGAVLLAIVLILCAPVCATAMYINICIRRM